ncbi:tudor domain-containing protein 6 isoform X3 [Pseudophryne corroboree]|uniref:tudor domain-containing protein 6 isoform X3 n=1 Tax=Pseudophryne corroboree TaxID=495146 RepID=UPI0030821D45
MLRSEAGLPVPGSVLGLRVTAVWSDSEALLVRVWGRAGERAEEEHRWLRQEIRAVVAAAGEERVCAPAVGQYCLVQEEEAAGDWLRCKVTQRLGPEYRVYLLDRGGQATALPNTLRPAPSSLFHLPPQALGCVLANLVPLEQKGWSTLALCHLHSLLGQEVKGLVKDLLLPLGIVILDLPAVSKYLLDLGLAKSLPDALFRVLVDRSLAEAGCSAHWPENTETHQPSGNNMSILRQAVPWQSMDYFYPQLQIGVTEPVVVTQVSDPQHIFCQLRSLSHEVQRLAEAMDHFYESPNACGDAKIQQPFPLGRPCASRGTDGHWYRSLLQEIIPGKQMATVIHVDWGRRDVVPLTNLRNLAPDFFRMPVVTFRCSLYGVSDNWDPPLLFELRSFLYEKHVIAKIEFFNTYEHLYVITLFAENGLNINCLYGMRAQNMKVYQGKPAITTEPALCAKDDVKNDTPKAPQQNFYVPEFPTVELKIGAFYDAMVDFVIDPSNFWIRTEEHSAKHTEMVDCITNMYSQASKLEGIIVKPVQRQLCCAKFKDDAYYRAEIVSVDKKKVTLYFLDHGNTDVVDLYDVKELPAEFRDLPALANRCCVADIYPLKDTWSHDSILAFKVAVFDKKLVICVVAKEAEKYTIEVLDQSRIEERSVGRLLWNAGYVNYEELEPAVQLPNVVKAVGVEFGQTALSQATVNQVSSKANQEITVAPQSEDNTEELHYSPFEEQLFEPGARIEVVVSYVENPGLFWCQNLAYLSELSALMKVIQTHCLCEERPYESGDLACLAQCPDNGIWYRAFITEIPSSISKAARVEVLYVDYGNKDNVPVANLRAIKSDFFHLKAQAFKCSVYNLVTPIGSNPFYWDVYATKVFHEFVREASKSEFHCTVFAVASLDKMLFNIVDLSSPFSSLCDTLVKRGFATRQLNKTLALSVQLHSYYYSMHGIKTGNEEEIFVTHVNPSLEFYCQLSRTVETIEKLSSAIMKVCHKTRCLKLPHDSGPLCLAKFSDQQWYRGFIRSDKQATAEVFFVDFGNVERVAKEDVLPITSNEHDLMFLPMQAIKCSLPDIPSNVPGEVVSWFEKAVLCKALRALVVAKDADGKLSVELYDGSQQINATIKSKLGLRVPKIASNAQETISKQIEARMPLINVDTKESKVNSSKVNEYNYTMHSEMGTAVQKTDRGYPRYQASAEREVVNKDYTAPRFQDFSLEKPFNNVDARERKSNRQVLLPRESNNAVNFEKPTAAYPQKGPGTHGVENKDYTAARFQELNSQKKESMNIRRDLPSSSYQERTVGRDTMPIVHKCPAERPSTFGPSSSSYQERTVGRDTMPIVNKSSADRPSTFTDKHSSFSKSPLTKFSEMPRRQIFPGIKMPVYISHLNTVFDFYVQFAEDSQLDEISALLNDDRSTFEVLAEKDINVGDVVCAYFADDELYYRAVVTGKSIQGLNVQYIDYGNTAVISNCTTYRLTLKLCSLPIMSVRCSLSRPAGVDPTPSMDDLLNEFSKRTSDFQLDCKFVKQYDLKWDVMLNDERGCINDLLASSGRHSLEEHIKKEVGEITTEEKPEEENVLSIKSFKWNLPLPGKTVTVYASAVDSPEYFWCQLSTADIDSLAVRVQEAGEQSIKDEEFIAAIQIGNSCNVMYSEDENWYRAIVTKLEADLVTVRFIDYGNEDSVSVDQIRQLSDTLLEIPAQAFPCCLAGFNSKAGTWTSEGRHFFYDKVSEDLLQITVLEVHDKPHLIPLAFVSIKYNDIDFNEEMICFWKTEDTIFTETGLEDVIKEDLEDQPPTEGFGESPATSLQISNEDLQCDKICPSPGDENTQSSTDGVKEASDLLHSMQIDMATPGSGPSVEGSALHDTEDYGSSCLDNGDDMGDLSSNIPAQAARERDTSNDPDYAEITSSLCQESRNNSESLENLILQFSEKLILRNQEAVSEDSTQQVMGDMFAALPRSHSRDPQRHFCRMDCSRKWTDEAAGGVAEENTGGVGKERDKDLACEDSMENEEKVVERGITIKGILESIESAGGEDTIESKEAVASKCTLKKEADTLESKKVVAVEFTLEKKGGVAVKGTLESKETVAGVDIFESIEAVDEIRSLESQESLAVECSLESIEGLAEERSLKSQEVVASEDILEYEEAVSDKDTQEKEAAVVGEGSLESKATVVCEGTLESQKAVIVEDTMESQETLTDEDSLEYEDAVADEDRLEYKEAVTGEDILEYEDAVTGEDSLEYKEAVACKDILEYKEDVSAIRTLESKEVAGGGTLESVEAVAGECTVESKKVIAGECSFKSKEVVAREIDVEIKDTNEAVMDSKETVPNEDVMDGKEDITNEDVMESKEDVASEDVMESKEDVASDDIMESKEDVASDDVMESKGAVTSDDVIESKEEVASDNVMESKEDVASDNIVESKEDITNEDVMKRKEDIAGKDVTESKEDIMNEDVMESKADVAIDNIMETKEAVASDDIVKNKETVASDVLESKETVASEDVMETKETVASDDIMESKEDVAIEDVMEIKEDVASDDIVESKETIANDYILESKEDITNEDVMKSEEDVAIDNIMETKEPVASDDVMESKEYVASDDIVETKEDVASDDVLESKEHVAYNNDMESKEDITMDDVMESKETVVSNDTMGSKEAVACDDIMKSKEYITNEGVIESKETVASEDVMESKETVACKEDVDSDDIVESTETVASDFLESKETVASDDIMESKDDVASEDVMETKEDIASSNIVESKETVASNDILESKETVGSEDVMESKETVASEDAMENKETVAGDDIMESKEDVASEDVMETKEDVASDDIVKIKEAIANDDIMERANDDIVESKEDLTNMESKENVASEDVTESKEDTTNEDVMESKEYVAIDDMETKEAVASDDIVESKETVGSEDVMESKETVAGDDIMESKEDVASEDVMETKEDVASGDILESKETVGSEDVMESKETVASGDILESKETVGSEDVMESKETVAGDDIMESKEDVASEDVMETKEDVASDDIVKIKEAIANDDILESANDDIMESKEDLTNMESKENVASEDVTESKEDTTNEDVMESKEYVAIDDMETKEAVASDNIVESKETVGSEDVMESKETVGSEDVMESKETVAGDDIMESKETIDINDILERKEDITNEDVMESKDDVARKEDIASSYIVESKETVASGDILECKETVCSEDVMESKETVASEDVMESKETVAGDDIMESKEDVASEDVMETKEDVARDDIVEIKETIANYDILESKENVASDDVMESKEDITNMESKENVASVDVSESKEDTTNEYVMESKKDVAIDDIMETKEAVASDDIVESKETIASDILESKETVGSEDVMESKETVAGDDIMESKEDVASEDVMETKEDVASDDIVEIKETIANDDILESKENVASDDIVESKEDLTNMESKENVASEDVTESKEDTTNEDVVESKEAVASDDILESKENVASEGVTVSKEAITNKDVMESKEDVAIDDIIEIKEAIASDVIVGSKEDITNMESKENVASEDVTKSKEDTTNEDVMESKEDVAIDDIMGTKEDVASDDIVESKETVASEDVMESKETVDSDDVTETKETVDRDDIVESKQYIINEDVMESKEDVTSSDKESKEDVASNDDMQSKEDITNEDVMESKETVTSEDVMESKEDVASSDVASSDFMESKETVASEDVMESKEDVASSDFMESKETVASEDVMESKEDVASDDVMETREDIAGNNPMKSREFITNEDVMESKKDVASDDIVESKETIASDDVMKTKDTVASDDIMKSKETVASDDIMKSKEDVASDNVMETKEDVTSDDIMESKETVASDDIMKSKEDVASDDVMETKEHVASDNIVESKDTVASEDVMESKDAVACNVVEVIKAVAGEHLEKHEETVTNQGETVKKDWVLTSIGVYELLDVQQASEQEHEVPEDQVQEVCRISVRKTSKSHDVKVTAPNMSGIADYADHSEHSTDDEQQTVRLPEIVDVSRLKNTESFLVYRECPVLISSTDSVYESDVGEPPAEVDSVESEVPLDIFEERFGSECFAASTMDRGDVTIQDVPECEGDTSCVTVTEDTCETDTDECHPETAALGDPGNKAGCHVRMEERESGLL